MKKICGNCKIEKDINDFHKQSNTKDGRHTRCKVCRNLQGKMYMRNKYIHKPHVPRKPSKYNSKAEENTDKKYKKYGIDKNQYDLLYNSQNGCCAICDKQISVLHIDHKTNKVRGLLCGTCNSGIGHLKDDVKLLQKAINYLSGT